MALPNAGVPLSIDDIHIEVGGVTGTTASLNDADIRTLVGTSPGTTTSISDYYGTAYNEFAALIGPNDTGDSYLYGYQTLNAGAGTVLGSEGLHTFNFMKATGKADVQALTTNGVSYTAIDGWKRTNAAWNAQEASSGYNIGARSDWIQSATGFSSSNTQMTIIEYRIYPDSQKGDHHNGLGMSYGLSDFSDTLRRSRMFSFDFSGTDVNRGRFGRTSSPFSSSDGNYSDKNNITAARTTGRSTVTMFVVDTSASGVKAAYYSNNGGAVQTAFSGVGDVSGQTVSNWYLHLLSNPEYRVSNFPAVLQNTGFQNSINQGFLYVDRIVSTTELANVSSWLYNNSGVPNHTDETTYTDGTF